MFHSLPLKPNYKGKKYWIDSVFEACLFFEVLSFSSILMVTLLDVNVHERMFSAEYFLVIVKSTEKNETHLYFEMHFFRTNLTFLFQKFTFLK
jgi:hypothetical protein